MPVDHSRLVRIVFHILPSSLQLPFLQPLHLLVISQFFRVISSLDQERLLHGRVRMQLLSYLSDHESLPHRVEHSILRRHKQEIIHIR